MHALFEGRESSQGVLTDAASADDRVRPLAGLRVLVTRPSERASRLTRSLVELGAVVDPIATVRIGPPTDPAPLDDALEAFDSYDWVVLTSVTGVERLAIALDERGIGPEALRLARIAAVGPSTAAALEHLGACAQVVPDTYRGADLATALLAAGRAPESVLIARAAGAGADLPGLLRRAGVRVDDVPLYETRTDLDASEALREVVQAGGLDWVTFTSPSTARAYVEMVGPVTGGARIAVIGPVTAAAVAELGFAEAVVAAAATADGLVEAIVDQVAQ